MANIVFGAALSHSPLMNFPVKQDAGQIATFQAAVLAVRERLAASKPDVLVVFGPDHFRTLFYDLMPAFAIGIGNVGGWGDWDTPTGPFETHPALAKHILENLLADGFEPSFSKDIKVDHGVTQPLQLLNAESLPIVPILVNAAAPPLPSVPRCHAFGTAVGKAIDGFSEDIRIGLLASGGLSHDPPAPSDENAIHGRTNGFAANRDRETTLMRKVDSLQARINADWDRRILHHFSNGTVKALSANLTTESIFNAAGNGGQEVRTWVALAGALADARMRVVCYEPIEALITGMGVVTT